MAVWSRSLVITAAGMLPVGMAASTSTVSAATTASSSVPGAERAVLHGCVATADRNVSIPRSGRRCPAGTTAVSWDVQGPPGSAGAPGGLTGASASSPASESAAESSVIRGCVGARTRALTIPVTGHRCPRRTAPLGWQVAGPPGPAGEPGAGRVISASGYGFSGTPALASYGADVWVANSGNNSVTEIRASDGGLVRRLTASKFRFSSPGAIFAERGRIWVANDGNYSLTELNASTGSFIRYLSGKQYGFRYPTAMAFDGSHIWVANGGEGVSEINAANGRPVRTIPEAELGSGGGLYGIAFAGHGIWVAACGGLEELSDTSGKVVRCVNSSSYGFDGTGVMASDGTHIFVANTAGDSVTEVNASTGSLVRILSSVHIYGPDALLSDGAEIWVGDNSRGITELNSTTGTWLRTAYIFDDALTLNGDHIWAAGPAGPSGARVVELPPDVNGLPSGSAASQSQASQPASGQIRGCVNDKSRAATVPLSGRACPRGTTTLRWNIAGAPGADGFSSWGKVFAASSYNFDDPSALAYDGTHLWVANSAGNSVTELNAADGGVVRVLSGSSYNFDDPSALVYDGRDVWVANSAGNSVTELSAGDGGVVRLLSASAYAFDQPDALAYDGTHLWIADRGSSAGSITKVNAADGSLVQVVPGADLYGASHPQPDALAFDGTHIWVADYNGSLWALNASDGSPVAIPHEFTAMIDALAFDGANVWAGTADDSPLVETIGGDVLQQFIPGTQFGLNDCTAVIAAGGHIWVANGSDNSVSELPAA